MRRARLLLLISTLFFGCERYPSKVQDSQQIQALPVILDLSRSHTVEDLKKSSLVLKAIVGGKGEQDFFFQEQEVEIRLPGARSIRQFVALGIIDSQDGTLSQISMSGDVMPHDQAVQILRAFHQSFGLSVDSLSEWDTRNKAKVRDAEPYSISANLRYFPRIGVGAGNSMNGLYPWVINLNISWDWDKHRDWNEERAWRELPAPEMPAVSLNPPSGLKYERKEAYWGWGRFK